MSGGGLLLKGNLLGQSKKSLIAFFYNSMRDPGVRSTRRRVRVSVCQLIQVPQPRSVSMQIESFGENGASCKERAAHKAWRGRGNLGGRGICLSVIAD